MKFDLRNPYPVHSYGFLGWWTLFFLTHIWAANKKSIPYYWISCVKANWSSSIRWFAEFLHHVVHSGVYPPPQDTPDINRVRSSQFPCKRRCSSIFPWPDNVEHATCHSISSCPLKGLLCVVPSLSFELWPVYVTFDDVKAVVAEKWVAFGSPLVLFFVAETGLLDCL